MFHDSALFLDQAPAVPAPPVSRIRCPRSIPVTQWPTPDAIAEELRLFADAGPQGNKTLH
ncbi:hypothetical protein PXK01_04125 [Phaeobacter sp. PT47_59]|uniref:hypothetical protein n=1 Tax=Phaeobacter sp. PT47_59 TaxID=3029979 RepID=UPI0023802D3C|nr:hypothetical protein [Phaeobacter sp. PT47_59]MDE4173329.1 hypothetical protein [Phaeobacter sp. PT47_59]